MSPRKKSKDEDIESDTEAEIVEVSIAAETEAVGDEVEVVAETPEEAAEAEILEVSAGGWAGEAASARTEVMAEAPEEAAEVGVVAEDEEMGVKKAQKANFKALARDLYQMGLDLGLTPDEAALLTSETKLPPFINEEGKKEFTEGLVEAYQEMLDERLQDLKQKLGVG